MNKLSLNKDGSLRKKYVCEKLNENGKMDTKPTIWTKDVFYTLLIELLDKLKEDKGIIYKNSLLLKNDMNVQIFIDLSLKYKKVRKINLLLTEINRIIESRLIEGATNGIYKENFTKFLLINRHKDWSDKKEVDSNVSGTIRLSDVFKD